MATSLEKLADGRWKLKTDAGTEIIAPGGGRGGRGFVPAQASARAGIAAIENAGDGIGVHYAVRNMETFAAKRIS